MPALLRSVFRSGTVAAVLVLAACSSPPAASAPASPTGPTTVGTPPTSATAPTVSAAPAVATTSTRPRVVVLDPGHNGGNAGAPAAINRQVPDGRGGTKACNTTGTSTDAGYAEHAFTLDVAQRVEKRLVASGVRVELTRLGGQVRCGFRRLGWRPGVVGSRTGPG